MLRLRFEVIMRPRSRRMACWLVDVGRPEEFVVRGADVAGRRRLSTEVSGYSRGTREDAREGY